MPYIGNQPGTGVRSRFIYTATASQTTFSGADDNNKTLKYADSAYVDVFLNGVCLVPGTDYTASTKTSVVLTQAASLSDTLEVVAYDIASMADTVSKADGGTFEDGVTIRTADNTTQLTLESTDADATVGPRLDLYRNSASPAANDYLGQIRILGEDSAGNDLSFVSIFSQLLDPTDGSEDGSFELDVRLNGSNRSRMLSNSTETVFNEDSQNIDFRVESDDNATGIFLDASESSLGIGVGTADTTTARMSVALTGAVTAGDTDGATIGKEGIFRLVDDTNWSSSNSTLFLMGGGTASGVGQIASAIGFARESNTNWGTQLKFYTHPTPTTDLDDLDERMRITSGGNLLLGSGYDGFSTKQLIYFLGASSQLGLSLWGNGGNGQIFAQFVSSGGSRIGSITQNGTSAISYNTSSDYRLKENVTDVTDGITRVKKLSPKRFNWIADESNTTVDGFLAHEAATVVPEAVTGTKDETEAIGNVINDDGDITQTGVVEPETLDEGHTWTATGTQPVMQGIDQSKLVPLLTAALQEAIAKIETLETKVAALEAG